MKNPQLKFLLVLMMGTLGAFFSSSAQIPYILNTAGGYGQINGQLFDFNIGEMVLVHTFNDGPNLLSQGFLQPYLLLTPPAPPRDIEVLNNVITPNGDGKNDLLLMRGLENYPGSRLSIYDRAGRIIYTVIDYKNNWDGRVNGVILNEDTYFYVLDLGKGFLVVKGFVSIVRDDN